MDKNLGSSYKLFNGGTSTTVTQTNKSFGNYSGGRTDVKKLSDCLSSGSKYRLAIHFSDNKNEWISRNYDYLYTYTEPTLSSLSVNTTSINPTMGLTFTLNGYNNRAHTDKIDNVDVESPFKTYTQYKLNNGNYTAYTDKGDVGTITWSAQDVRNNCPYSSIGDSGTITMQVKRNSPTPNIDTSGKTASPVTIYWKPVNQITTTTFKKNNSSSSTVSGGTVFINDNNLTGVYVSWDYDTTVAKAGYTEGYRVRVYKEDGTTTTYDTTTTNKYITIPKANIPTGQSTKISITPYYKAGQANKDNYRYATESKMTFVKIIANLAKPVITYPINNTTWINKYIRIGFQLPNDADYSVIGINYRYEDIELMLDNTFTIHYTANTQGATTTGTNVQSTACFSTTTLSHQKKIIVQPSIVGDNVPLASGTHTVKVRVKNSIIQVVHLMDGVNGQILLHFILNLIIIM